MDRSKVKEIVDREIEPLMQRLGLSHWNLVVSYGHIESGGDIRRINGQCTRLIRYNQAHIELDPEAIDDEAELRRLLVHELAHIILSPFDLYATFVEKMVVDGTPQAEQERSIWSHCCEQAVINVERMYRGFLAESAVKPPRRKK